jgi:hypothetical protein
MGSFHKKLKHPKFRRNKGELITFAHFGDYLFCRVRRVFFLRYLGCENERNATRGIPVQICLQNLRIACSTDHVINILLRELTFKLKKK